MPRIRHMGVSLIALGISLITASTALSADTTPELQPFTAQYQLNRGRMIVGKVTTTLQLDAHGNYTYRSVTVPVGIVAAFSEDEITEESRGAIQRQQVIPSSYYYNHKRKKRPKLRRIEFDWSRHRATGTAATPQWSRDIPNGTQDSASKMLAMMLRLVSGAKDVELDVIDRDKMKRYRMVQVGKEQIASGSSGYATVQLQEVREGEPTTARFWLAPKLNHLPIKIEKIEKKDTFTMILTKFTQGQPESPSAQTKSSAN